VKARGIARHLEGWQPGLLAVFLAGVSTVLAVPRPVLPVDIPEPLLEPRVLAQVAREDEALAAAAERERLDTDVRALGSAMRAYGIADAAGDGPALVAARRDVAEASRRAAAQGEHALVMLRAYELRSFLREVRRWEAKGEETPELRELGGPFVARAQASGWVAGRHLIFDDTVRATMFKMRWNEIAMAHGSAFDVTVAERRALYRFLILHPAQGTRAGGEDARLRKIEELRAIDPRYPADLARGVVLYRVHRIPQAVEALRKHLEDHPDGPYGIRAQNYLAALESQ
jgi:hypothetical protein